MLDSLVIDLLAASNHPLTAYDLVRLSAKRGSALPPAQVYRVLDRLTSAGSVQRIELLAAYVWVHGEQKGFRVCRCCRAVETFSLPGLAAAVGRLCRAAGFSPTRSLFEVPGRCAKCVQKDTDPAVPKKRKDDVMRSGLRSLFALIVSAGVMLEGMPAEATERRPGVLYNGTGEALGTVAVTDAPKGVLLRVEAKGLPPGWHGMHFHKKADCGDAGFKDAGGHLHSTKPIVHGFLVEDANDAGDLPNIFVHPDGSATVELYSALVSMNGRDGRPALNDADGSALVIHANRDDYTTQPIGGAGDRIACAAIP